MTVIINLKNANNVIFDGTEQHWANYSSHLSRGVKSKQGAEPMASPSL